MMAAALPGLSLEIIPTARRPSGADVMRGKRRNKLPCARVFSAVLAFGLPAAQRKRIAGSRGPCAPIVANDILLCAGLERVGNAARLAYAVTGPRSRTPRLI